MVVGASTGGVTALQSLISGLPADFPGVVSAVLHRSPFFETNLARIVAGRSDRVVMEPEQGERVRAGNVYIAPRDQHLTFCDGHLLLSRDPKQHHTRPAIDPLFMSAAELYGRRVVGVVLTGGGDDGVDGLLAIKSAGGICIAQDPDEAQAPGMPSNALVHDHIDLVMPIGAIAGVLNQLAHGEPVLRRPSKKAHVDALVSPRGTRSRGRQ